MKKTNRDIAVAVDSRREEGGAFLEMVSGWGSVTLVLE